MKRFSQLSLSLLVLLFGATVSAQPEPDLNGSFFQPPGGDGSFIPLDQPPRFIYLGEDGRIILQDPDTSGPVLFMYIYESGSDTPTQVLEFPGSDSVTVGGVVPDAGLPGDGDLFFNHTRDGGDIGVGADGEDPPAYRDQVISEIETIIGPQLQSEGCLISRISYNWDEGPYYTEERYQEFGTLEEQVILTEAPGVRLITIHVFIHCSDRRNYELTLFLTHSDTDEVAWESHELKQISPDGSGGQQKGDSLPVAALPPGNATITHRGATAAAYLGRPVDSASTAFAVPTLAWLEADGSIDDWLQIDDFPAGLASDMQICGSVFSEHLWLAWTDSSGNGQVAHVLRPDTVEVTSLGPTAGLVVMDCDYWGNALAAVTAVGGNRIDVYTFAPNGDQTGSVGFGIDGPSFTPMSLAMNNNGEAALAFSDNDGTFIQRITVNNAVEVDMSFAGSWNSPFFDGEGFIWDIAEVNGVPTLVLYYFSYQNDSSGRQAWVVGSAPLVNGVANIPMAITQGATFGQAYDSDDVSAEIWGNIEVRTLGCRSALVTMTTPLFGNFGYPAVKFTAPPSKLTGLCAPAAAETGKAVSQVDGSFSGSYFNPDRNFEGFIIDVTEVGGQPTIVVYWFSYDIDGSGRQLWLVGAAPISGDSVTLPLVRTEGGQYGPNFDPDNVTASSFVTVTVSWSDCDNATVMYEVDGGETGSFDIQRLAALPTGAGGVCGQ